MLATQTKSQVIRDFLLKYMGLSDKKKARVDKLFKLLPVAADAEEQSEIAQAIQEIVDPSLATSTEPVDPDEGVKPEVKAKLAAYRVHIGRVVRKRRNELGMTQEQLAERSGLPQSHISRIESGQHTPTHVTIEKLSHALETEPGKIDLLYMD